MSPLALARRTGRGMLVAASLLGVAIPSPAAAFLRPALPPLLPPPPASPAAASGLSVPGGAGTALRLATAPGPSAAGGAEASAGPKVLPFAIDRIERDGADDMKSVSQLCVNVFFNDGNGAGAGAGTGAGAGAGAGGRRTGAAPWKEVQLAYLRNLQFGDLKMKFFTRGPQCEMFFAREVVPAPAQGAAKAETVDVRSVYNAEFLGDGGGASGREYVLGDVLGFVEVAEKVFRIGERYEAAGGGGGAEGWEADVRPFLSNLSVAERARGSGVGSGLVECCESSIQSWPTQYKDIVLQVEDDNKLARSFYEKRGYVALFADPACRRFDTSGFLLRKVPTTKVAMRKVLGSKSSRAPARGRARSNGFSLDDIFGSLFQNRGS